MAGTRPEAIKLAPVIDAVARAPDLVSRVLVTAQHRELLDQVLVLFGIEPDIDLDLMRPDQKPAGFTGRAMEGIAEALEDEQPDFVLVQGDTMTTWIAAMASYYGRYPVGHVEAGLRSYDLSNPFPEEAHRRIATQVASLHFAPTEENRRNLESEGVRPESVLVTGNPGIDALFRILEIAEGRETRPSFIDLASADRRLVLLTVHRRESLGEPLRGICRAVANIVKANPQVEVLFPVHPNPAVERIAAAELGGMRRVHIVPPLDYMDFVQAMKLSYLILTDSGGVQEEAPSLGTPVLVMRDATERPEVVAAGAAQLVGRKPLAIESAADLLLSDASAYEAMTGHANPFGDGLSADRIVAGIRTFLEASNRDGSP